MTAGNTGAAREVPTGRLAGFEESDDVDAAPAISLPPRRTRYQAPSSSPAITAAPSTPAPAPEIPQPAPAAPVPDVTKAAPETRQKRHEDSIRPSNAQIPVALMEPLDARCKAAGFSHGEIIIVAIENAYSRLKDLINPVATAGGGGLFAERRGRVSRAADGPLSVLTYRLREADYATLDRLVQEFGASSRAHLITVALTDYLGQKN